MGHYTMVLKFDRSVGKNGKNTLTGEFQKEGIRYEGGMIPLGYPIQSSYAYNFLHAIFCTYAYE